MISVPEAATARAARPIFSVMAAVVFGLTMRMRTRAFRSYEADSIGWVARLRNPSTQPRGDGFRDNRLYHALAGIRPVAPLPSLEHENNDQRRENNQKGYAAGQRSQRIDVRLGDSGGQALQFKWKGVDGTDGLARTREFVPRQGEAKQADAHHGWQYDRQHDMPEGLPWRRAKVPRGFLEPPVEAVENRKHDQQAKRKRPGQMRAKARGEKPHGRGPALRPRAAVLDHEIVQQPEFQGDAERGDDRRHDQAGDRGIEQDRGAAERSAERHAGRDRQHNRQHHDEEAELERPLEGGADIHNA